MESDCCDQESSSARRERSRWSRATLRMQARSLWYLSLCQACYHVNSVQRIVIFLSLSLFFVVGGFVVFFFFFLISSPQPLSETMPTGFKVDEIGGMKTQRGTWVQRQPSLPFAVFCLIVQLRKYLFFI